MIIILIFKCDESIAQPSRLFPVISPFKDDKFGSHPRSFRPDQNSLSPHQDSFDVHPNSVGQHLKIKRNVDPTDVSPVRPRSSVPLVGPYQVYGCWRGQNYREECCTIKNQATITTTTTLPSTTSTDSGGGFGSYLGRKRRSTSASFGPYPATDCTWFYHIYDEPYGLTLIVCCLIYPETTAVATTTRTITPSYGVEEHDGYAYGFVAEIEDCYFLFPDFGNGLATYVEETYTVNPLK